MGFQKVDEGSILNMVNGALDNILFGPWKFYLDEPIGIDSLEKPLLKFLQIEALEYYLKKLNKITNEEERRHFSWK